MSKPGPSGRCSCEGEASSVSLLLPIASFLAFKRTKRQEKIYALFTQTGVGTEVLGVRNALGWSETGWSVALVG